MGSVSMQLVFPFYLLSSVENHCRESGNILTKSLSACVLASSHLPVPGSQPLDSPFKGFCIPHNLSDDIDKNVRTVFAPFNAF